MFPLLALLIALALGFACQPAASASLADFRWLAGCWEMRQGERVTAEHWMEPTADLIMGMSRTIRGDKAVEFEFLRISREADGSVYYIALPSGQTETRFKLVDADARSAVFENRQHDFPQRIRYRLREDGSLLASIEGPSGGQQRTVEFPMRRLKCPGQ
ncbi:MAG: hypothetical protein EHM61_16805 [Acidobacteria bacterium]|nr:MAG: hypothetical protein EHM61_16805 [Acidobacteriota bacterium]